MKYQQHPETGMVQRVHADGTPHLPSYDQHCADESCETPEAVVKRLVARAQNAVWNGEREQDEVRAQVVTELVAMIERKP